MFLEAHTTCTITCLHLAIPHVRRLLLTHYAIPWIHLLGHLPSLKSLFWEVERESKMTELTGPMVHRKTVRKSCQKLFSPGKETVIHGWTTRKWKQLMSMEHCHSHIATALFTDTGITTLCFSLEHGFNAGKFHRITNTEGQISRWLHSNL